MSTYRSQRALDLSRPSFGAMLAVRRIPSSLGLAARRLLRAAGASQPHRAVSNAEGTGPPRVLITGGLGQLGRGLAETMRCVRGRIGPRP